MLLSSIYWIYPIQMVVRFFFFISKTEKFASSVKPLCSGHHRDLRKVSVKKGVSYMEVLPILVYFAWRFCFMLLGDSAIDSIVCQEAGLGKAERQYIRESHAVGEWLQYVKKSTIGVDENTVAVVCTNFRYKRIGGRPCAAEHLHDCIHVSIPVPLPFGHTCNCETCQRWKWKRTGNPCEYFSLWTWKCH